VRGDTGAPFEKVALEVDDKPLQVLIDLAKQRGLVLSDTSNGLLLCWQSITDGVPVANFSGQPLKSINPKYNAQEYFSEVTGYAPPRRRKPGDKYTAQNPWLRDRMRPMSFKMDDTETGDAPTGCNARLGRMFANMMGLTISDIPTWRDPQGAVWSPNTMVTVHAPEAMIYAPTKFLVRDVTLVEDAEIQTAELNLVLPGAFSGEIPARLPWDEPTNPDDPLAAYEATLR
jgi:prophage tail gpP-like protein